MKIGQSQRFLKTKDLLHHLSTTPYSLFTFLVHNARQFACEQALLLVDSREVTREPHAKRRRECEGRELARRRHNSELLPLYSANFASFSESYCCHLSPQSFNSTCFVFSSHFVIFQRQFFLEQIITILCLHRQKRLLNRKEKMTQQRYRCD